MTTPDNPNAFPIGVYSRGISLRDYFAAKIAAALTGAHDQNGLWTGLIESDHAYSTVARMAYQIADAMLAERGRKDDCAVPQLPAAERAAIRAEAFEEAIAAATYIFNKEGVTPLIAISSMMMKLASLHAKAKESGE